MYARIREEGLAHSRIMEYATGLFDDIGPRLTGSPNLTKAYKWTSEQFTAMGCSNVHLEGWGDFGMGWRQIATSVDMASPDTAVFIAQATPWSPATSGSVHAFVIAIPALHSEKDFDEWKGRLAGKIILYGNTPAINPDPKPLLEHYDAAKLEQIYDYPLNLDFSEQHIAPYSPGEMASMFRHVAFKEKVAQFFADEGAAAVLVYGWGGNGGIMRDDNSEMLDSLAYRPDHKQPVPSAVIAHEAFGRVERLLEHNMPVTVDLNIHTEFTGDHAGGYNTIAEIPGTDPALKDQVVMVGGHLDSWIAGTGATDDGAGAIVAMEAMRILTALHVQPRRTIRIALWSGEEQGEFGSLRLCMTSISRRLDCRPSPSSSRFRSIMRERIGPLTVKPEHALISGYFNLDNGGGKLLGIYAENNAAMVRHFQPMDCAAAKTWVSPPSACATAAPRTTKPSTRSAFQDFNSSRTRAITRHAACTATRMSTSAYHLPTSSRRQWSKHIPLQHGHARPDAAAQGHALFRQTCRLEDRRSRRPTGEVAV